jgi:hypothetical protein
VPLLLLLLVLLLVLLLLLPQLPLLLLHYHLRQEHSINIGWCVCRAAAAGLICSLRSDRQHSFTTQIITTLKESGK